MTFNPMPKEKLYRCQRLLDIAAKAPKCFHCDTPNDGTVVAAHINALWAGKGMGQKAHDLVAFYCQECHTRYDNNTDCKYPSISNFDWLVDQYKTTVWLLQAGYLKVISNP